MVEQLSSLQPVLSPGSHGNFTAGTGVRLSELQPASIVQVHAWRGAEQALLDCVRDLTGLNVEAAPGAGIAQDAKSAFGIGPGRVLVVDQDNDGLAAQLAAAVTSETGTVTDLSHARTVIRISGGKSEWVLAKLFAIDFSAAAFPVQAGRATQHHDFFVQIQRTGADQFDLYVFRSFARSFWHTLCEAAEEVGYEVR